MAWNLIPNYLGPQPVIIYLVSDTLQLDRHGEIVQSFYPGKRIVFS